MKFVLALLMALISAPIARCNSVESGFYQPAPSLFSSFSPCDFCPIETDWIVDVDGGYTVGSFIGLDESYSQFGLRIATPPFRTIQPLIDLRGYRLEDSHWASSCGVGVRWTRCTCDDILGFNLFYDFRATDPGNFNRVGLGLEWFTECFDYRLNGYFPLEIEVKKRHWHIEFPHCFQEEHLYVPYGADFLISRPLWMCEQVQLEGTAGSYYYYNKNVDHIFGLEIGVDLSIMKYVTCEARMSYDNEFKANFQGTVMLVLPLADLICPDLYCEERPQIVKSIKRNGLIFDKKTKDEFRCHPDVIKKK